MLHELNDDCDDEGRISLDSHCVPATGVLTYRRRVKDSRTISFHQERNAVSYIAASPIRNGRRKSPAPFEISLSSTRASALLPFDMDAAERYLTRWQSAGLLNETTVTAIRNYERLQVRPAGRQWQVLLALILGAILLGAGVLLFVAAHWDAISPLSRMCLTLLTLVFFHGLGIASRDKFPGFATAMHALGTISAGAAIALVGQIFNMQEHWPAAVMLWAACTVVGWLLLRDQFQQTLALLLIPAWIFSEWIERASPYSGVGIYFARMIAVVAAVYLTAFLHSRRRAVAGILFGFAAVALPISIGILAHGWQTFSYEQHWGFVLVSCRIAAFAVMLVAVAAGAFLERQSIVPAGVIAAVALILPWAQKTISEGSRGYAWQRTEPSVLAYAFVAAAAVVLVWWGVHIAAKSLVNYGVVAFAATVMWFYFSSVMDKLGRSLGLIMLGVLFLAGGWALERTRRRLVASLAGAAA